MRLRPGAFAQEKAERDRRVRRPRANVRSLSLHCARLVIFGRKEKVRGSGSGAGTKPVWTGPAPIAREYPRRARRFARSGGPPPSRRWDSPRSSCRRLVGDGAHDYERNVVEVADVRDGCALHLTADGAEGRGDALLLRITADELVARGDATLEGADVGRGLLNRGDRGSAQLGVRREGESVHSRHLTHLVAQVRDVSGHEPLRVPTRVPTGVPTGVPTEGPTES